MQMERRNRSVTSGIRYVEGALELVPRRTGVLTGGTYSGKVGRTRCVHLLVDRGPGSCPRMEGVLGRLVGRIGEVKVGVGRVMFGGGTKLCSGRSGARLVTCVQGLGRGMSRTIMGVNGRWGPWCRKL